MTDALDGVYRSQRARLTSTVTAMTARLWAEQHKQEQHTIQQVLAAVYAGQRQVVALVDAFMGLKARTGPQGLDPSRYMIDQIRGVAADELYRKPWAAMGSQLGQGAKFATAADSAQATLAKLVRTDLQLAQTHSARDWMTGSDTVTAYRRDAGRDPCELCNQAAQGVYSPDALAAIHEHCSCAVIPLFGDQSPQPVDATVRVANDSEIGPRLLAPNWAA